LIKLVLALAVAASLQLAPPGKMEKARAEVALRAAIDALDMRKLTVNCWPNSLYREDEPCGAAEATIRRLDLRKLVHFELARCTLDPPKKCAILVFDRGRGDGGVTGLELTTVSGRVQTAADVKAIAITQWIAAK
jgi:hypothetical protein